ncbi:molybdopterin biosynthesis protein MoaB [Agrilactobacillus composti DSM 18527 = JCM 14202]|uniref:Molybdenum cofactor biosynthesis protein B n=1 Tax=Agrilactobacillus composti DSM 18527 = JCM 14202 TaxID=1423734 RepID=A0A0R1XYN0_9LACO|nr:molybdenum cofactor biosynthesis protein B [Agrilactobacillus composti]KRM33083.1 molybdopterin biosynthesis protein MoaB [Agrilactobacillus composti DSM 18527 = JCM 14202]
MLNAAILTVSDTRHLNTDKSGQFLADYLTDHDLARVQQRLVVTDDILEIQHGFTTLALTDVDLILTNGGTGIAKRDVTLEALTPLLAEEIPGFGELFRQLSYADIGTHALASRATAGFTHRNQLTFILPGSTKANQLALEQIIVPELAHLLHERAK